MDKVTLKDSPEQQVSRLAGDPFSAEYDESRYFLTPELQQRLDLSRHLLEYSQQVLLVNGENGVGKSCFCEHLANTADESWLVCKTEVNEQTGPGELVRALHGDCCVFCSYGDIPCPPIQENGERSCAP